MWTIGRSQRVEEKKYRPMSVKYGTNIQFYIYVLRLIKIQMYRIFIIFPFLPIFYTKLYKLCTYTILIMTLPFLS